MVCLKLEGSHLGCAPCLDHDYVITAIVSTDSMLEEEPQVGLILCISVRKHIQHQGVCFLPRLGQWQIDAIFPSSPLPLLQYAAPQ